MKHRYTDEKLCFASLLLCSHYFLVKSSEENYICLEKYLLTDKQAN